MTLKLLNLVPKFPRRSGRFCR